MSTQQRVTENRPTVVLLVQNPNRHRRVNACVIPALNCPPPPLSLPSDHAHRIRNRRRRAPGDHYSHGWLGSRQAKPRAGGVTCRRPLPPPARELSTVAWLRFLVRRRCVPPHHSLTHSPLLCCGTQLQ